MELKFQIIIPQQIQPLYNIISPKQDEFLNDLWNSEESLFIQVDEELFRMFITRNIGHFSVPENS